MEMVTGVPYCQDAALDERGILTIRTDDLSVQQGVLKDIGTYAAEISQERERGDTPGIPEELDFFEPHGSNASSRTDNED